MTTAAVEWARGAGRAFMLAGVLAGPCFATPVVVGFERFHGEPAVAKSPGLLLYNELKCAACHGELGPMQRAFPPHAAPLLDKAGARLRIGYLRAFIANPASVKPGTLMPDMLAGLDDSARATASDELAHYLASLGGPLEESRAEGVDTEAGEQLFHRVGCVACHEPRRPANAGAPEEIFWESEATEAAPLTVPSVPLPDLAAKTTEAALAEFLLEPEAIRPGGRMPDMSLSAEDARQIAAWLTKGETGAGEQVMPDPVKAARGKERFRAMGCVACHGIEGGSPPPSATSLAGKSLLEGGCLAPAPIAGVPWFDLGATQRQALLAMSTDAAAPTDRDRINYTIQALNCYACHESDGLGGPEPARALYFSETEAQDLGDEGRMPPTLTGVGGKLTPAWLRDILTDGGRVRPYMATRMPHFGEAQVGALVEAFANVDADRAPVAVNVSGLEHHHRNQYGRELMGTTGLGCVTCHDLNGHRSLGIPAVDLAHVPARLQPEWFMRYMLDPASLRPQTRMPAFFENGKSKGSELFKGDAVKQVEALWIYLKEVNETRLPEGMEATGGFELIPTDAPIVHRTFMEGVGPRAIAVGFPGGLNYAFDADNCRVAMVWRGRFIDAESAWADRFTPFVSPLGEGVAKLPDGHAVALGDEGEAAQETPRFLGYRLDETQTPIFRYQLGSVIVEESLRPAPEREGALLRRIVCAGPPQTVLVHAGMNPEFKPVEVTESGTAVEEVFSW